MKTLKLKASPARPSRTETGRTTEHWSLNDARDWITKELAERSGVPISLTREHLDEARHLIGVMARPPEARRMLSPHGPGGSTPRRRPRVAGEEPRAGKSLEEVTPCPEEDRAD